MLRPKIRGETKPVSSSSRKATPPNLALVVPCYNEEEVLPETASRIGKVLAELSESDVISDASIYFIDDGSTDNTWDLIARLCAVDSRMHALKLSTNYGHQKALLAGLLTVPGDAIISIDADLQDDLSAIKQMVTAYCNGAQIVYGIRRRRRTDSFFKRATAEAYYRVLLAMGVRLEFNHADYRLLSRTVIEVLRTFKETNLLLRGLIPLLGFSSEKVYYERGTRFAGKSKYPLSHMLALAVDGITSFTEIPLKLITLLGMLVSILSFGLALWALLVKFVNPAAVPGWASIVIPLYLLGGIHLLCMGVIGQYLAKIYTESKARPRFIIEKTL
jgi:glycosyltransferase involved in cell wall biosynthesis